MEYAYEAYKALLTLIFVEEDSSFFHKYHDLLDVLLNYYSTHFDY